MNAINKQKRASLDQYWLTWPSIWLDRNSWNKWMKKIFSSSCLDLCLIVDIHLLLWSLFYTLTLNSYFELIRPHYRLQRSYIFTSVCHTVQRVGVSAWHSPWADTSPRHASPPGQTYPMTRHPPGQIPLTDGYCCRWYTSYWNVFLPRPHEKILK